MSDGTMHVETDVLVIGSGGAGMYAAIEAARAGCQVLLADRSLIGRGGATVMAQMTVAVALGAETPDHWSYHFHDTLDAGRGLCDERLAACCARKAPTASARWTPGASAGRARTASITQAFAPGHDRPRCVYVDFLNTGPAVSKTLRSAVTQDQRHPQGRRSRAWSISCRPAAKSPARWPGICRAARRSTIAAKATIVATGGLTRLYRRNSASANMGGDGYALALRAGAPLIDMEFVQFFPIGHLAPRLIGMDPIMWDPFRYKLGGRLLNSDGRGIHRALRRARGRALRHHPRRRAPTPSSRRSRPAAARRTAAPISASSIARRPRCARRSVR